LPTEESLASDTIVSAAEQVDVLEVNKLQSRIRIITSSHISSQMVFMAQPLVSAIFASLIAYILAWSP
jgi:hypothetical protein